MAISRFAIFIILLFLELFSSTYAQNIYQYTQAGQLTPTAQKALHRVYVPNSRSDSVSVIDTTTYKVIQTLHTGREPQHVVPSYDLQTLWVLNNKSNSATPIDPQTGVTRANVAVDDPYNLYFTPDGKFAVVVCEGREELEFRDPHTLRLLSTLKTRCKGANHMDFTADNHYAIVTCEFDGQLMKVDVVNQQVIGYLSLRGNQPVLHKLLSDFSIGNNGNILFADPPADNMSMPQDIRLSPDGSLFYVADMMKDGVILIEPTSFKKVGFIHTGIGTHAVYPSRNGKLFYVSNRGCHHLGCPAHGPGSVSVIDPFKKAVVAEWPIPGGGSPDMGNISTDGNELWLTGRYDSEVYVFDTRTGQLAHRIPVGREPHGLCYWPQPGRFSLGHTGNMR